MTIINCDLEIKQENRGKAMKLLRSQLALSSEIKSIKTALKKFGFSCSINDSGDVQLTPDREDVFEALNVLAPVLTLNSTLKVMEDNEVEEITILENGRVDVRTGVVKFVPNVEQIAMRAVRDWLGKEFVSEELSDVELEGSMKELTEKVNTLCANQETKLDLGMLVDSIVEQIEEMIENDQEQDCLV